MIENTTQNQLAVNNYATISGIKGKQFGREVFSTLIQFKDLMTFLEVFPEVQRDVSTRRVNSIKNYVLSGLAKKENGKKRWAVMRFFSSITVTARGNIFYDEEAKRLAIDTVHSKLSINDGQHRFYGISEALRSLNATYNRSSSQEEQEIILQDIEELRNMVIPMVIFNGIDESEEKQLFHDLNNLAQRPSRSATIRLAQTDLYSRLSREIAEENKFLNTYGVEMDKMSIHKNNKNLILLTTIHYMIRELVEINEESLVELNYDTHKQSINSIFNSIFESLPDDISQRGKYLIEKNYALKAISKFIVEAKKAKLDDQRIYQAIKETNWNNDLQVWSEYGATEGANGILFAGGDGGIKAILSSLSDRAGMTEVLV